MEPLYWLILLAIFLVIEIITLGLTTIWLAGGALVGFLAAVLHVPLPIQIVLFLVVSIVLIVFTRPVAERYFNNSREQTNVGGIIGREGKVIVTIDNFNQTGAVLIDGIEWTAQSDEEDVVIETGERIVVTRVEGVRVFVKVKGDHLYAIFNCVISCCSDCHDILRQCSAAGSCVCCRAIRWLSGNLGCRNPFQSSVY